VIPADRVGRFYDVLPSNSLTALRTSDTKIGLSH
jgi:hypothetical protein